MKTIVQCYFPMHEFQGFGVFLSATMNLHHYCSKRSIEVIVSYAKHEIIQSLMINTIPLDIDVKDIIFIRDIMALEEVLNDNSKDIEYVCFYGSSLLSHKDILSFKQSICFVKDHCLNVTNDVKDQFEQTLTSFLCIKHEYVCLHVRVGDEDLVDKVGVYKPLFEKIMENVKQIIDPMLQYSKVVVVSDSEKFKELLKQQSPNLLISSSKPTHLGILKTNTTRENVLETLTDFFLLAFSSRIIIISSNHQHPLVASFFSKICSFLYDIPVVIKKIHLEIFSNSGGYN